MSASVADMQGSLPKRVLIVEDDPGIAELERECLESIGCHCDSAYTGSAAKAIIKNSPPDLMVIDYSLPDMNADDLVNSETTPPFMIATGKGDESTAVRLMRAGARDYVIKDSSFLEELPVVVERVLREIETERNLAATRSTLEARLLENEALLREIHHRVKNNLQVISSLIRLQALRVADDDTQNLLVDIQCRISAMAIIHEILYGSENLAKVDFLGYLEALASNLAATYSGRDSIPQILCSGDRIGLPIDRAVPLGLVANELMTNALKHAFPPQWKEQRSISVKVESLEKGGMLLEITDNGIGMRRDMKVYTDGEPEVTSDASKLGLKLVDILVKQLGAEISFDTGEAGQGLRCSIRLADKGNV